MELLQHTRTLFEQLFLLYADPKLEIDKILDEAGAHPPLLEVTDEYDALHRMWKISDPATIARIQSLMSDKKLLIADGHHRYETTLALGGDPWLLAVIVPTDQEGLTIFPTHRVARSVDGASGRPIDRPGDDLPGPVLYRGAGRYELLEGDGLDPEIVDALQPEGVTYTPQRADAEAAVDSGDAEAAFLLRPTRIEDVWDVAQRGDVMPQKSTFFYPKLTSGLLLLPLD
jgi:uncharacterized protein (DUF1015 family)